MKKMFNRIVVMACCIATAYGTVDAKAETINGSTPQQKITKEGLDNLAEQLLKEKDYDDINQYPNMNLPNYKDSINETIKLAIREKTYNDPGAEELKDIFDDTIGDTETENYLMLRFLCKYMLETGDSIEVAIQKLSDIFDERLQNVAIFAKVADIEELLKTDKSELVKKLRELTPQGSATPDEKLEDDSEKVTEDSSVTTIDGAKNIFEFIKTKTGQEKDYIETCNELIKQIPPQTKTEVLQISGNIIDKIVSEKQQGNTPLAVNWRLSATDAGNFQKYAPELSKNLNNASVTAKESICLLSENLQATTNGTITSDIDLITTTINDKILSNQKSMLVIARLHILMAVLSKHDVLIVDLAGLNLPKEQFATISQIYTNELMNPLIKDRLKEVLFVI